MTGAAGFIGSHLCDRLLRDGHEVIAVDSYDPYYSRELKTANLDAARCLPGFDFRELDLLTCNLDGLLEQVSGVFHLAGQPGVRPSWGPGFEGYTRNNLGVTQALLEALVRVPRPAVQASSSSVYGARERERAREDTPLIPASPYGMSKMGCEHLARIYATQHGTRMVSLRYFTVYGPRQRPDMAFTRFIQAGLSGTPLHLLGTGRQTRDFTYVTDIVDATIRALGAPSPVYNLGGGTPASVRHVIRVLGGLLGAPLDATRFPVADGDVSHTWADTTRARRELGWRPAVALRAGLASQVNWVRSPSPAPGEAT